MCVTVYGVLKAIVVVVVNWLTSGRRVGRGVANRGGGAAFSCSLAFKISNEILGRYFSEGIIEHAFHDHRDLPLDLWFHGINDEVAVLADPRVDPFGQLRQLTVKQVVHSHVGATDLEIEHNILNHQMLLTRGSGVGDTGPAVTIDVI